MTRRQWLASLAAALPAGSHFEIAGMALQWCPPGRFLMGSPESEPDRRPDEGPVEVTLSRGFWMGRDEVTQAQWLALMGTLPREMDKGAGPEFPIYWVSYLDAQLFCARLTARAAPHLDPGWSFNLPTEAQWEYACRAGSRTATAFGDTLGPNQANFNGAIKQATPVGHYPPNAWGLRDMHGNEFEWCRDWYHARLPGGLDPDLSSTKGTPNRDGTYSRARRGGAWNDPLWAVRSANRLRYEPERTSDHIGFRVVLEQKP